MRNLSSHVLTVILTSLASAAVAQTVLVNENFDSYANTAAMNVNWNGTGAGIGTLDTAFGNPGQSARNGGTINAATSVNRWTGSAFSLIPSASLSILMRADIYNPGGTDGRETLGLRNASGELFELGHYNAAPVTQQYGVRFFGLYDNSGWRPFTNALGAVVNEVTTGTWDRYEALFTAGSATITLDIGADGIVDGWVVSPVAHAIAVGLNDLRFGGPSGVDSLEAAWFDNIYLATIAVPEPSTVTLLGLGALGLLSLRRRASAC